MQIGIIGCGIAGVYAGNELAKKGYNVTIFTDNIYWDRSQLYNICFDNVTSEVLINPDINLKQYEPVMSISSEKKVITQKDTYNFDKIIIATGSKVAEKINKTTLKNIYNFFDKEKVEQMVQYIKAKSPSRAIIIGGGCIGIEASLFLSRIGLSSVTIIEKNKKLLNGILDEIIEKNLTESLEKKGITIKVGSIVSEIVEDGVLTIDKEKYPSDIIINASGLHPKISIKSEVKVDRGYIIDDHCETSIKDVFAIGNCSEKEGIIKTTIENAIFQSKMVTEYITNGYSKIEALPENHIFKNFPIEIRVAGKKEGKKIIKRNGSSLRIAYMIENTIAGFQTVNDFTGVPSTLFYYVKNRVEEKDDILRLLVE